MIKKYLPLRNHLFFKKKLIEYFNEVYQLIRKEEKIPVVLSEFFENLRTQHNEVYELIEKHAIPSPFGYMSSSVNTL